MNLSTTTPMSTPPNQPDVQSQRFTPLEKKDVAVVVPTRNSAATLRQCPESIKPHERPCMLVVVDNGSTDDTPSIASEVGQGYRAEVRAYERTFGRGGDAIEAPRFFRHEVFDLAEASTRR
jgi:glycosyltransferase involved in cell wall biosynthesis